MEAGSGPRADQSDKIISADESERLRLLGVLDHFRESEARTRIVTARLEAEVDHLTERLDDFPSGLSAIHLGDLDRISRLQSTIQEFSDRVARQYAAETALLQKQILRSAAFPFFAALPLEIREDIWELAIPRRTHRLDSGRPKRRYRPHAIAHACRESRRVALRTGGLRDYFPVLGFLNEDITEPSANAFTWVDCRYDTIILDHPQTRIANIFQAMETVMFNGTILYNSTRVFSWLFSPVTMPRLKFVQMGIQMRWIMNNNLPKAAKYELFDHDPYQPLLVDIDDEDAIRKMADLFDNISKHRWRWLEKVATARDTTKFYYDREHTSWEGFVEFLQNAWVQSRQTWTPWVGTDMFITSDNKFQVLWDHPWVQSIREDMPRFQRVLRLELR